MTAVYVVVGLLVLAVVAFLAMRSGAPPEPGAVASSERPSTAASPVPAGADVPAEMLHRVKDLERRAPQASAGDGNAARALYEEAMAIAETSGGRRELLVAALEKLTASQAAKHNAGLVEAGFAEVLRHAAHAVAPPDAAVLDKSLEYAQKATAANSIEGEAWVAYAHALVATGSVDDGIAVMNDHQAYTGYRMFRARAAAALAKGQTAEAAAFVEKARAGCTHEGCRAALQAMLG